MKKILFLLLTLVLLFSNTQKAFCKEAHINMNTIIAEMEENIKTPQEISVNRFLDRINYLRTDINKSKVETKSEITALESKLSIVNKAIKDIEKIPPEIQTQIDDLNAEINKLQGKIIDYNLNLAKIDNLETSVNTINKDRILSNVKQRHTFPFSFSSLKQVLPEIVSMVGYVITEPYLWLYNQIREHKYEGIPTIIYLFISVVCIFMLVFVVKRLFLKHLDYRGEIEEPNYPNKLIAAFVEALSNGILPAAILGMVYYWFANYAQDFTDILQTIILGGLLLLIFLVLIHSIAKAIFAPNMLNWRLTTLKVEQTRRIYKLILLLGAIFGFHLYFSAIQNHIGSSQEAKTFLTSVMNILEVILILLLLRNNLWMKKETAVEENHSEDVMLEEKRKVNIWLLFRNIMSVIILLSGISSLLGYIGLGDFVIKRFLYSTVCISLFIVLRSFLQEISLIFINSPYAQKHLGLKPKKLRACRFWLMLLLDVAYISLSVYIILPLWGVPQSYVLNLGKSLAMGFSIGGVTVSLVNIVMAIIVFFIIKKLFYWLQGWLKTKIFPATDVEESLQDSLSAGIGYIGMIMGFFVSISVLGINFTNLAIVAGALSVGIGFGLQNIVNNFVSGIIILLERPIKVGDWIIINGNEGVVSRISFRATEIETFNKASILIPNADIISNDLLNWTHNNHYGRVDISVVVSYKSNIEEIRGLLLDLASQNSKILFVPQPQVVFVGIDEDSLKFELRFYVSDIMDSVTISTDMRYTIMKKFKEEGIEIPYRHQVMHIEDKGKIIPTQATEKKAHGRREAEI